MEKQLIISVSREFGSGGQEVAGQLAQRFGLPLYDRNILEHIAQQKDLPPQKLQRYDESPSKLFVSRRVNGFSNSPEENVAQMQFQFLRTRALAGESFVVLGRCADEILRDFPCLVSVFVLADLSFKVARTMRLDHVDEDGALERMARYDRRRKYYHNQHSRGKWGDSRNYDLCINSAKLDIQGSTDIVEQFVRARLALL